MSGDLWGDNFDPHDKGPPWFLCALVFIGVMLVLYGLFG